MRTGPEDQRTSVNLVPGDLTREVLLNFGEASDGRNSLGAHCEDGRQAHRYKSGHAEVTPQALLNFGESRVCNSYTNIGVSRSCTSQS